MAHSSASGEGAIARLAAWVASLRVDDFPARAIEQAKLVLLDTIGCGLAARDDESACAVLATLGGSAASRNARCSAKPGR